MYITKTTNVICKWSFLSIFILLFKKCKIKVEETCLHITMHITCPNSQQYITGRSDNDFQQKNAYFYIILAKV